MALLYENTKEGEAAMRDDKELREMACLDMPASELSELNPERKKSLETARSELRKRD